MTKQVENIAWDGDELDRKASGDFLSKYLINRFEESQDLVNDSFVLNLNTEWGFGKTYFLKNLALSLKKDNYPVVYFDAWQSDFSNEPLLAFISEINDELSEYFTAKIPKTLLSNAVQNAKKLIKPTVPILLSVLAKKLTGYSREELNEILSGEVDGEKEKIDKDTDIDQAVASVVSKAVDHALLEHKNKKKSIVSFKDSLGELINYIGKSTTKYNLPLFVFVDELDRCRPSYAIELLENIKHLFGVNGVYFVVATDLKQLGHSVCAVYGNQFESERYLKRFFNQEYTLPSPNNINFARFLFNESGLEGGNCLFSPLTLKNCKTEDINVEIFYLLSDFFKLSLRDQMQCFQNIETVLITNKDRTFHSVFLFFLIILKHKSSAAFYKLCSKFNREELYKIIDKMSDNGDVNRNVEFKSGQLKSDRDGWVDTNFPIESLIESYIELYDRNIIDIMEISTRETFSGHIQSEFTKSLGGGYNPRNPPKHDLHSYKALVESAGQIN